MAEEKKKESLQRKKKKSPLREKADRAKRLRCKTVVAVLEDPTNTHNVGSVIRNIDAIGVSRLYVVSKHITQAQFGTPGRGGVEASGPVKTSSVGASRFVYTRVFPTTQECMAHLARKGFVSVVTSPHVKGKANSDLYDMEWTKYKQIAIWFGNETRGISATAVQNAVACVQLQMAGLTESFNLACAAAIVLYHVTQTRRRWKKGQKLLAQQGEQEVPEMQEVQEEEEQEEIAV